MGGPLLNAHRILFNDHVQVVDTISNWYGDWGTFYIFVGILYLPFIFTLQFLLRKLPPIPQIRYWVIFHNVAFTIFSTVGAIELTSTMYETWDAAGWNFHKTVCDGFFISKPESHWVFLFVLSKLFELCESIYIILEKKPLRFLHWYHHFVTYTFSVYSLILNNPSALYYAWMNLAVHAIMYFYYSIATITQTTPSWGIVVTLGQIVQMIIGVLVTYEVFSCENEIEYAFPFFLQFSIFFFF